MMLTLPMVSLVVALFSGAGFGVETGSAAWAAFADGFREFAHVAAPVAVTALWQGAVVAAGLALCLRLAPRVAAAHRFAAWAAGYGVLVALPFVPALSHLVAANAGSNIGFGAASLPSTAAHAWLGHPWLAISDRWSLAIAALWVLAALARAIDLAIHTARLRRLWKSATPIAMDESLCAALLIRPVNSVSASHPFRGRNQDADPSTPVAAATFAQEDGARCLYLWAGSIALESRRGIGNGGRQTRFELCTTRELDRPSVIGFFAPRILIPEWLLERLSRQELEQVVLHEAEHLRRRDDWTNLLQKLCLVVFPLNPALGFIERSLCREREMACDEGVVRQTQAPRAYAACLAGLAERHMERRAEALSLGARAKALTLSAFERRTELARRVHSILARRSTIDPLASRALVGAVGCALAVGAVMLARCPQLIAFVPAEPQMTAEARQAEFAQMVPEELRGDKVIAPADSHFRAMNAMAIVPGTAGRNATNYRVTALKAGQHAGESKIRQTAGLRQTVASAVPAMTSGPDAVVEIAKIETAAPQELIVLTAFEQVQATGNELGDRVVSDFGATNARPTDGSAGQVTITRLIFRIYQAGPDGQKQLDANSLTGQPKAVPLGNGWFVIQL
jgi:Zn-dependent protease with chaperone function